MARPAAPVTINARSQRFNRVQAISALATGPVREAVSADSAAQVRVPVSTADNDAALGRPWRFPASKTGLHVVTISRGAVRRMFHCRERQYQRAKPTVRRDSARTED